MAKPVTTEKKFTPGDLFRTKAIPDIYSEAIKKQWKMEPNWPPGTPMNLGDYGIISDGVFQRIGNIKSPPLKIKYKIAKDREKTDIDKFCSSGSYGIEYTGKVKINSMLEVATGFTIKLGKRSTFIDARDCYYDGFESGLDVNNKIIEASTKGIWRKEFCYVTRLLRAKQATVIVTQDKSADIEIGLSTGMTSPVGELSPSLPGLKFKCSSEKVFHEIGQNGLTLMMNLWKIVDDEEEATPGRQMSI